MRLLIPFIGVFFLYACNKSERITPKLAPITESVYSSGIVKTEKQYKVYAKSSGILTKRFVSAGDLVKEGDILFRIDNREIVLETENAALALVRSRENHEKLRELRRLADVARIQYEQDSLMYMRQQNLWKQKVGTQVELEQKRLAVKSSKNSYLNSLDQLNRVKTDLKLEYESLKNNLGIKEEEAQNYVVKSELNGRVFTIYPEEGEAINAQSVLAIVGKPDSFLIEMNVDENDIGKIRKKQVVFITMDSFEDTVYKAFVSKIHPIMNEETSTFKVEGYFSKAPFRLYPNLSLEANILVNEKQNALVIPRDYLVDDEYVLVEKNKKVKVKVGLKNYEFVEIIEGLNKEQFIYKP